MDRSERIRCLGCRDSFPSAQIEERKGSVVGSVEGVGIEVKDGFVVSGGGGGDHGFCIFTHGGACDGLAHWVGLVNAEMMVNQSVRWTGGCDWEPAREEREN
uniref:Uncharacterized protein n=1 Tax=Fagus sylvatica TaxID=28930 RepID=A0A2N9EC97_FAGSY